MRKATNEMTIKHNHVVGRRASPRCGKPLCRERGAGSRAPVGVGCCGHPACRETSPRPSCRARRQRQRARRPAPWGHGPGITERLLCLRRGAGGCLQGLSWARRACRAQLRQQRSSRSTLPIVFRHRGFLLEERNALIFLRCSFKKCSLREINCFLLLFHLNLKFMDRYFSWGLYTWRSFIDF